MYEDLPINHQLRLFYRVLAALIGLAMLAYGVAGLGSRMPVPGLAANLALAIVALLLGAVLVVASVVRRELSHLVYLAVGGILMTMGLAMLLLMRTANIFGAAMTTCVTSLVLGLTVFLAGTYTRTGTTETALEKELRRRGGRRPARPPVRPRPTGVATRRVRKATPRSAATAHRRR